MADITLVGNMKISLSLSGAYTILQDGDPWPLPDGADGGVYDPSNLGSLYQDAAGLTPVTGDGDPVGRIEDLSGNGYHMIQATNSARPTYKTDGTLHWIESNGVDEWLYCSTLALGTNWTHVGAWQRLGGFNRHFAVSTSRDCGYMRDGLVRWNLDAASTVISGDNTVPHVQSFDYVSNTELSGWHNGAGKLTIDPVEADMTTATAVALFSRDANSFVQGVAAKFFGGVFMIGSMSDAARNNANSWSAGLADVTL